MEALKLNTAKKYIPNWMKIKQKTKENIEKIFVKTKKNIEKIFVKNNKKQDTLEQNTVE